MRLSAILPLKLETTPAVPDKGGRVQDRGEVAVGLDLLDILITLNGADSGHPAIRSLPG